MNRCLQPLVFALAALVGVLTTGAVFAHALGIDRANLIELPQGQYRLEAIVLPKFAPLISAPILPPKCSVDGSPQGQRGPEMVSFSFTCSSALTAEDTLELPWRREGVMLSARWLDGSEETRFVPREGAVIKIDLAQFRASSGSWVDAAIRYTQLGFEHILSGFDHLMFVFALILIVRGVGMLIKTITAFTVAHSITLGLATFGFINLPTIPVETVIALSIVLLGAEILRAKRGDYGLTHQFPWIVAFMFGLLHGLGFAGALADIGLAQSEIPVALLFFNIGVELGQLLFVFAVLLIVPIAKTLRLDGLAWPQTAAAYLVGTVSTFWVIERLMLMFA